VKLEKLYNQLLEEITNKNIIFNPRNLEYLDAWLNIGDEDMESYKTHGLKTIKYIIDEVRALKFPLRVYRGISWHDDKEPNILKSTSEYESNISWTTDIRTAQKFGNVVFTGIIPSLNDLDIEYTIKRRIMHKPLDENEIIVKNGDNSIIKNIKKLS